GVLAGAGKLSLPLCIVAAAGGAFVGDNISYGLGTLLGERTVKRFFSGEKSHRAFAWAERMLDRRGTYVIIIGRFIPGGRTATTFSAGYVHSFSWRRFVVADAIAASLWGTYSVLVGYFGGKAFEDEPWKGLVLAFAIAAAVTAIVELVRRMRG